MKTIKVEIAGKFQGVATSTEVVEVEIGENWTETEIQIEAQKQAAVDEVTHFKILGTATSLNSLSKEIHESNVSAGWWTDLKYDDKIKTLMDRGFDEPTAINILEALGLTRSTLKTRNVGELLKLVVSELSEAMEGHRKNLMDDKLPHRKMFEVEIGDAFIRLFDIAGAFNLDLDGAIEEKRAYNKERKDHKIENRLAEGGKAY